MVNKDEPFDPNDEESLPKWGEMLKKVIGVGLGAAFMTEESVRSALGEIKLPKEVLNNILQSANRSKEDFLNRVGTETIKILSKIDFVKEASRFVEEHKFRVQAEIEIVKRESRESSESRIKVDTQVKIRD